MATNKNNPIKWSGSKAPLAEEIITKYFPKTPIDTYYEPFCGSCAVMLEAVKHHDIKNVICSDLNQDLINLWNEIKNNPERLAGSYKDKWQVFNQYDEETTIEANRKLWYTHIRKKYNEYRTPENFLFLLRTSYNGLVRYNSKGGFNSPCHFLRPGIEPYKLEKYILEMSDLLNKNNVRFICCSYTDIKPEKNDFVFLDPPYDKSYGTMYNGCIDEDILVNWCNDLSCGYAMTYNGNRGNNLGRTLPLRDIELYELTGKNSSFLRLKNNKVVVKELIYVKN